MNNAMLYDYQLGHRNLTLGVAFASIQTYWLSLLLLQKEVEKEHYNLAVDTLLISQ